MTTHKTRGDASRGYLEARRRFGDRANVPAGVDLTAAPAPAAADPGQGEPNAADYRHVEAEVRLIDAEFRAAAAGRIEPDRLAELVEDLDLGRYIGDDGLVDVDRVRRKVDAWSPAPPPRRPRPDPTQGARQPQATSGSSRAMDGHAAAVARFGAEAVAKARAPYFSNGNDAA